MQLKKLEIQGFKSFADKTQIAFLDGVTTIVGPNGSGKSNISDSVRWVLGEQSVKTLRGAKMEDVIFAGTEARKKVGFAEVSMYLDNSDSVLPIEYNEVVVTRRVYRTGESNYLINGNECRLKDIQELFMDTGIGKDGYSIISQGKIDEILSTKSEERRHIFEEASGIVKYRTRKEEATKKLENTENSLNRVSDVLREIENVIGPLEKKCETAKKYLNLRDELKILDVRIFIDLIEKNDDELAKLNEFITTFQSDISSEEQNIKDFEDKKQELKIKIEQITKKIEDTQKKYFDVINDISKLESKIQLANVTIENSKNNIERLKVEIAEDNGKIEVLKEDIQNREIKRQSMAKDKEKFEFELNEKQSKLKEVLGNLDKKGLEIEEIKKEVDSLVELNYELKVKTSSMLTTIEANEKQILEKDRIDEKNEILLNELNSKIVILEQELDEKNQQISSNSERITILNEKKEEKLKSQQDILDKEASLRQEIMSLTSKYTYLENLENENEGYQRSVKNSLEYAHNNNISGVYGTIASVISTDEKYEYAIEIALGGYMQNIIVETDEIAKNIIEYLKENKLGRATFLPLSSIKKVSNDIKNKVKNLDGYIGMAIDLVNFDDKYFDAVNLPLNSTVIVDNIENAIKIAKKLKNIARLVTLSGELIANTGSITGGHNAKSFSGVIGRREKIEKLKSSIQEKEELLSSITNQIDRFESENNILQNELIELEHLQNDLKIDIATKTMQFENLKQDMDKTQNLKLQSQEQTLLLTKECDNLREQVKKNDVDILNNNEEISKSQEIIDEYARFHKENQKVIDGLNEDIVNLKISLSSFDESVSSIDEMKQKIEQDIQNFEEGINRKNSQIKELEESIEENKTNIKLINEDINKNNNIKQESSSITEELKNEKEQCLKEQEEIDKNVTSCIKKMDNLREQKAKVENNKVKYDVEITNLKNKMWEDYELTVTSSKNILENLPEDTKVPEDLKKCAENIRKEIKDLGEVNVSSIEEYKETKERYDFITDQKSDLEETRQKLQNLINNMTTIMKQQFSKQFSVIANNFDETFKELFGGGKAILSLSDSSDVLNSGIDIEVQPPGKKLQSMMLLSGGERALTAIALLFAILKIKTPPFCILDEIEAALDDVNVHRFAEYIKKYSDRTQFIVITHRKGTMEVASSTYGVTMQEYGVSKVISMKLQ